MSITLSNYSSICRYGPAFKTVLITIYIEHISLSDESDSDGSETETEFYCQMIDNGTKYLEKISIHGDICHQNNPSDLFLFLYKLKIHILMNV